ncbi:MAG: GNAT family N-acetyltransferase [Caldilineaceae bacterium]
MDKRYFTVSTTQGNYWKEILRCCGAHDIYHLPEYHQLAEEQHGDQAELFVFEQGSTLIAMPLMIRRIDGLPGIGSSTLRDATSVYGYPGPVSSLQNPSKDIIRLFNQSLQDYFASREIISAFSRLHPFLLDQACYLSGPDSQVVNVGTTVAIDLTLPVAVQEQHYRTNHKRDINKAKRLGLHCFHDQEWTHFDSFIHIYYETMRRTEASDDYFFDRAYFRRLRELLGDKLHLFVAIHDDSVAGAGLFTVCNSIIQYHLGGTDSRCLQLAPTKLIFDTVRLWGARIGATVFHLGGGVGSRQDSLFHFKAGFASLQYQFKVWKAVTNADAYNELVAQKHRWNLENGVPASEKSCFPAYRCSGW